MWVKMALLSLVLSGSAWAQAEDEKKKEEEAKAKIAEFKKELKTCKTDADLARAIDGLGSLQHPKILAELKSYLGKPSPDVSTAAAEQIGKYKKDKEAAEILMNAAGSRRDKEGIIKFLRYAGDVGYKGIASKLAGYFRHKEVDVAREAVDSLAKLKAKDSIDALLNLFKELDGIREEKDSGGVGGGGLGGGLGGGVAGGVQNSMQEEQQKRKRDLTPAVEGALEKCTDQRFKTLREWNDWWRKAKGGFKELD